MHHKRGSTRNTTPYRCIYRFGMV